MENVIPIHSEVIFIEVSDYPHGIFGPWARWSRGLARWESCRRAAAAAVGVIFPNARFSKEKLHKTMFCEEFKEHQ